ncbi:hypothetical protein CXF85_08925 [Colwellia sp. 75C3]|uniref:hypothetical protein n=1 Tax=Colwellia sp. 75C3 TaxID=888425 RepID=UPI000C327A31|nr:hypothetical protein [Colwellia sp. 75C3]PKG84217.1 hypothetical protein CXF85_08925 [Colwellia sp. 75C3]
MSSKLTKPTSHLQEDEAFINTLYQQFPPDEDQQPSEFLDKRIIKAAYQAVATESAKTNKKKITWFHSLATAASLILVISLVFQQQNHILPSAETSTNVVSTSQKDKQMSTKMMADEAVAAFSAPEPMMEKQGVIVQQSALAKSLTSTVIALKNQPRKIENKDYRQATEIQRLNQQKLAVSKRSPSVKGPVAQKFTLAQYQLYTVKNAQLSVENKIMWSLINEQADSYYITIYLPDNNTTNYLLAKTQFKLNALPVKNHDKRILNKQVFSEIILTNRQ